MKKSTPWSLLRGGEAEQETGLELLEQTYAKEPNPSYAMELGVALLWLRKYAEAWEHFRSVIDADPGESGDNDYGMAGVAKWCLGEPESAVAEWRAGLDAKFARAAGLGVRMPLLLYFASVVKPHVFGRNFAERLLLEKTKDLRIRTWPGPIAKFVLTQIDAHELLDLCRGMDEEDTSARLWLAEFYSSVRGVKQRMISDFKDPMRKLTDISQPEWQDETALLTRIWHEEYFLARHEAVYLP